MSSVIASLPGIVGKDTCHGEEMLLVLLPERMGPDVSEDTQGSACFLSDLVPAQAAIFDVMHTSALAYTSLCCKQERNRKQ